MDKKKLEKSFTLVYDYSMLTTLQAAEKLGLTRQAVWLLIQSGILPAEKVGRDYLIDPKNLIRARTRPGPGRPKKSEKISA